MTTKGNDKKYVTRADSSNILAPPPTSLLSSIADWSDFSHYFLDEHGQPLSQVLLQQSHYHHQELKQFTPIPKASSSSPSIQQARREIIASLSVRPASRPSSSSSVELAPEEGSRQDAPGKEMRTNLFSQYARLEKDERKAALGPSRGDKSSPPQGPQGLSTSAPSSPNTSRLENPADHLCQRKRAKSVEEALTRLGWFWNSEANAMWTPASEATQDVYQPSEQGTTEHKQALHSADVTYQDSSAFLEKYAAGHLDLNGITPGCPCPSLTMQAPLPPYEEARKRMICRSGVFALPPVVLERLDAIASHVRDALGMAIFMLDVLFGEEGWEVTRDGVQHHNNFRRETICAHTILNAHRGMTVLNLKSDWRFQGNPILSPVSFYSGFPIMSSSGLPFGALCVMDIAAHESFSDEQRGLIKLAAEQVSYIIETHFADNFLLKMTRLSTTYESMKEQLPKISRRALPRLDPTTFALKKPLNASDSYWSLGGSSRDLFSLNRCCQRVAAAMDLDAVYIVAVLPETRNGHPASRTHTIARSSTICPHYHGEGVGDCYLHAFDTAHDQDGAIFQNALDGVSVAPLPQPVGHAAGKSFTCAMVLPLLVRSRFARGDLGVQARLESTPTGTIHFALVAASMGRRHVLGIEDLRFLQSLRPHLLSVVERCVMATGSGHTSKHMTASRGSASQAPVLIRSSPGARNGESGFRADVYDQHLGGLASQFPAPFDFEDGSVSPKSSTRALPFSPSSSTSQAFPSQLPASRYRRGSGQSSSSPVAAHFADHSRDHSERVPPQMRSNVDLTRHVNWDEHTGRRVGSTSSHSGPTSVLPFPAASSSQVSLLNTSGRRGSGSGPLTRLTGPSKLMQAADSIRHTLHLSSRRSSNVNSLSSSSAGRNSRATRGSADSSIGTGGDSEGGHALSSSASTSFSSNTNHSKLGRDDHDQQPAAHKGTNSLTAGTIDGQSGRHHHVPGAAASSSSSVTTLTPASAPQPQNSGAPKSGEHGRDPRTRGPDRHRSLLSVGKKLRRPLSAKQKVDEPDVCETQGKPVLGFHLRRDPTEDSTSGTDQALPAASFDSTVVKMGESGAGTNSYASHSGSNPPTPPFTVEGQICARCSRRIPRGSSDLCYRPLTKPQQSIAIGSALPKVNSHASNPRLRASPQRPRTAGEHPREPFSADMPGFVNQSGAPTVCTCIVPTLSSDRTATIAKTANGDSHVSDVASPQGRHKGSGPTRDVKTRNERRWLRLADGHEVPSDLELDDGEYGMPELELLDSNGSSSPRQIRAPLRRLSEGNLNNSGTDLPLNAWQLSSSTSRARHGAHTTAVPPLHLDGASRDNPTLSPTRAWIGLHGDLGSDLELSQSGPFGEGSTGSPLHPGGLSPRPPTTKMAPVKQ